MNMDTIIGIVIGWYLTWSYYRTKEEIRRNTRGGGEMRISSNPSRRLRESRETTDNGTPGASGA